MYIELAYPEQQRTIDGTGQLTDATIQYLVFEAFDEADALGFAFQEIPKELDNLKLLSISISERKSQDIFLLEVTYGSSNNNSGGSSSDDNAEEEEATVNFDCTTGSAHVTSAIAPVNIVMGPDPGSAIGWNGKEGADSEISGVDIMVPTLTETYTKVMRKSQLTNAFRRRVADLTGKVNYKPFKGWHEGEVLFLGCSFTAPEKTTEKITVSFNFAIKLNSDVMTIDGHSFKKMGWQYLDVISESGFENGIPKPIVKGIYLADVYNYADFGALGL